MYSNMTQASFFLLHSLTEQELLPALQVLCGALPGQAGVPVHHKGSKVYCVERGGYRTLC